MWPLQRPPMRRVKKVGVRARGVGALLLPGINYEGTGKGTNGVRGGLEVRLRCWVTGNRRSLCGLKHNKKGKTNYNRAQIHCVTFFYQVELMVTIAFRSCHSEHITFRQQQNLAETTERTNK